MLVLGSSSEARKKLLVSVGLRPGKIVSPEVSEIREKKELPLSYVSRMARLKLKSIKVSKDDVLIAADTIAVVGRDILHKTFDQDIARDYLLSLSGRRHSVFTSFCISKGSTSRAATVKTTLKMNKISQQDVDNYIRTDEWKGCAGGYSIQGKAVQFFPFISGCFSNVIGLPIPKLISVLKGIAPELFFYD